MITKAPFSYSFLAPKYWLTWLSVLILYLLSWLPYRLQIWLGKLLGRLVYRFVKKRRKIAEVNIALAFPELDKAAQAKLVKENLENTGIAIFESGMAWWWPQWRAKKHFGGITGYHHIEKAISNGKGVLLLVPHMMHLEVAGRMMGIQNNGVGFYRPHNNPLMEYIIVNGRLRFSEALVTKRDVKSLLKALSQQKLCYYLPDQDYGRKRSEFVPFFAVKETCTTTGTLIFASSKKSETVALSTYRKDNKYYLDVSPVFENFPTGNDVDDVTRVNQAMEEAIAKAPEQYLWLHRRFKTQKDPNAPSHYKK
ncbi:LpxL/LpxP family Kdo(2)-lipid IV(A) lauroyl/palmitoleoyl acyltransferase [Pseudoalteromonas sp. XMcav1-K]|uniref:LpxL/LpxP family Kdo(2)-lipid IV(A) lauroyl/palmitoleoyl acyltransferase n=1 Tax=Pseudoalteromonas sp. XMcav1-K TaxID=3374372 RepID=UPI003757C3D4